MNEELGNTAVSGGNQMITTIHDIAGIWLTSAERLSALNINTAREVIEDQTAMARAALGLRTAETEPEMRSAQPLLDKALAYSRNMYEIMSETQAQLSRVTVSQLSGTRLPMPVDWNAAFDLFRASARQFSDMAAQNMTQAADTAAAASAEMKKTA